MRVEVLERELERLLPGREKGLQPLVVEVLELRRKLAAAEDALDEERAARRRAQEAAEVSEGRAERLAALEESLERVQNELQRRRRVGEGLWRKAAQTDLRKREADRLQGELKQAREAAEREARRADVAEIALIRTRMRLAVELARPSVPSPWPRDAVRTQVDALEKAHDAQLLGRLTEAPLRRAIIRLGLLVGDLLWNPPPSDPDALRALLELLQSAGHALHRHDDIRLGPREPSAPGLRMAIGPLALRVALRQPGGREAIVTLSDDAPLRVEVVDRT